MLRLMKLELKHNNLKGYILSSLSIGIVMTGLIYLFAYAPHIDPDPDLQIFKSYDRIIYLFSILNMAVFATLSAVIYTKFIIEDYKEQRILLLFSYPVKRTKILLAKIAVVFLFTVAAMILCNITVLGIFSISEQFFPIVKDTESVAKVSLLLAKTLRLTLICGITAAEIGVIAVGLGFIKKSVPTTIISAVLLSSLFCNIMFNAADTSSQNNLIPVIFMCTTAVAAMIVSASLAIKVNRMEAE